MKHFPSRLAVALLAGFLALPAFAADSIAQVNGVAIPSSRAEAMLAEQRAQGAPENDQLKNAVREELIRREVLSQEAGKKGLDKKADVQAQMDMARQAILIRAYLQDYVRANPISDADLMKEYDAIKGRMGDKEYKPRHVLVETEDQAKAKGFDKKADVQAQMEMAKQAILIRAYLQDFVKNNPVTDAEVLQEYETIKGRMGEKEYKPRHVLVETENEAKAIIAKLQSGVAFEEVAKESRDPGSKDRGGELGWSNPAMFVKPFSDAMVALEKGKYTPTPVKSDFGYHVIQLDDVRATQTPPFEEVKPQLQQRLQQQKVEKQVLDLRAKAKVE